MKRYMTCAVCGGGAGRWEQHWNRDKGFGVCMSCIEWLLKRGASEWEINNLYGKKGINWGPTGKNLEKDA